MKKSMIIFGVIIVILVSVVVTVKNYSMHNMDNGPKEVLYVLSESGFDHTEFTITKNMLEEHGVKVTLASTVVGEITDSRNNKFQSEMLIKDVNVDDYDMISIVGGGGMTRLKENNDLSELLKKANKKGKYIGGICYGPVLLAKAGVLNKKEATVYPNSRNKDTLKENGAIVSSEKIVVSGKILTAKGPRDTEAFGQKILELLGIEE